MEEKTYSYKELTPTAQNTALFGETTREFFYKNEEVNQALLQHLLKKYGLAPNSLKYDFLYMTAVGLPVLFSCDNLLTMKLRKYFERRYEKKDKIAHLLAFRVIYETTTVPVYVVSPTDFSISFSKEPEYLAGCIASELNLTAIVARRLLTEIKRDIDKKYADICDKLYEIGYNTISETLLNALQAVRSKKYFFDE